jgi:hypothetical protein
MNNFLLRFISPHLNSYFLKKKNSLMARVLMEEMMNSIFFVRILVKEMMSNVFLWDNPYSLQPTHLFISHKFHHLFFSYLVPQVTLSHFGPSFILFYTLAHLTLIIFLITWSQATSFYLNPSFLLFCTLVSCPFFLLILIFDFLLIYIYIYIDKQR